jgi:Zn-dependent protease
MLKSRYKLFELFNIPVYANISFFIILFLFISDFKSFSWGISGALVLAFSIIFHEFAHALTARIFGYDTHDITLSLIGGCASIIGMPRKVHQEFLTALAGPLSSFFLSGVAFLLLHLLPIENQFLVFMLLYMEWINLILGGFNLLPGFPMDGGRIFRSTMRIFMSRAKATKVAMWVGRGFAILLGLRGLHAIVTGGGWGFVSVMIAWMIWHDGWAEYQMALREEKFDFFDAKVSPPPYER